MAMTLPRRHVLTLLAAAGLWPAAARAAPRDYVLDRDGSEVRFYFTLSGARTAGTMPVRRADLRLDFERVSTSVAVVELQASAARTALIFATEALKSPQVLHTDAFPVIRFVSTRITGQGGARAMLEGNVTIRGVTRPLRLAAEIGVPPGAAPGDFRRLTVHLTGSISRSAFGASGYPDMVADRVDLQITAQLRQTG